MNARRHLLTAVWVIGGVVLYALCIDVFGGYPRFHTETFDLLGVLLLVLTGLLVWSVRRDDD